MAFQWDFKVSGVAKLSAIHRELLVATLDGSPLAHCKYQKQRNYSPCIIKSKIGIGFLFARLFSRTDFSLECLVLFDNRSLYSLRISLPKGTRLLSPIAGNSNFKQACLYQPLF